MEKKDSNIIHKCLDGDPVAFELIVSRYKSAIYALAYSKLYNFHDAEDVTQEVFIRAYRKLHTLKRPDKLLAWLSVITNNVCKNWIRAQSRCLDREFIEDQALEVLQAKAVDIHRETLMKEFIHELLDSLPDMYRQVLVLNYLGDMNSRQISELLNISPTAVRKRLSRARSQLSEEIFGILKEPAIKWIPHISIPGANSEKWSLSGKTLHYKGSAIRSLSYLTLGEQNWSNYTISCKARMLQALGRFSRIAFGTHMDESPDGDHVYHVFGPSPWGDTAGVGVFTEGHGSSESWKSIGMNIGKWYDLKVEAVGPQHKFFIDGELVASNRLHSHSSGKLGIGCVSADVEFDDVVIAVSDAPNLGTNEKSINLWDDSTVTWGRIRGIK